MSALRVAAPVLIAAVAAAPVDAQEQGWAVGTQSAAVVVQEGPGSATVSTRLSLVPLDSDGPTRADASLTLELLVFRGVTISDPRRAAGDRVLMWPASGRRLVATVGPPFQLEGGVPYVELTYVVEGAVSGTEDAPRVRVPLLSGPAPPAGSDEGDARGFTAGVQVPSGWRVVESFPTGLAATGDGSVLEVALPVTPAMISFHASSDGAWRPGLPFAVDLLTAVLLLGFAAYGWRHLRGVVAGRRAGGGAAA